MRGVKILFVPVILGIFGVAVASFLCLLLGLGETAIIFGPAGGALGFGLGVALVPWLLMREGDPAGKSRFRKVRRDRSRNCPPEKG